MKYSYIYIISDGVSFKVGISVDPAKRIKALQTGSPKKLELLHTFKIPKDKIFRAEKECHSALNSKFIKRGEWFHNATEFSVRIIVDEICDTYN